METQSSQSRVARQIINRHHGDVVEGEIKSQGAVCHRGNTRKSAVGAVTGELQVAVIAGRPLAVWVWPLTPGQREEDEEEDEVKIGLKTHTTGKEDTFRWEADGNREVKDEEEESEAKWRRQTH